MSHILTIAVTIILLVFYMCCYYYFRKIDRYRQRGYNVLSSPGGSVYDTSIGVSQHMTTFRPRAVNKLLVGQQVSGGLLGSTSKGQTQHHGLQFFMKWKLTIFVLFLFSLLINFNIPNIFTTKSS